MKNEKYSLEATFKHQGIEQMLTNLTGVSRKGAVAEGSCTTCMGEATSFKDEISRKEYTISGMCQSCQDDVFGHEDEEPVDPWDDHYADDDALGSAGMGTDEYYF